MLANRARDTRPELAVRRAVHRLGLRYRIAVPLGAVGLPRRSADMLFRRSRVAVFVDGCFWHGCPIHHTQARANRPYWSAKVLRNRQRDADTDQRLLEAGWLSLRVWEHEDPMSAAARIAEAVQGRSQ